MPQADIEARDLVVVREGRRILDGASLRVGPGETAVIEGPSGSGKSTLLRVLATLTELDSGSLLLGGVDARTLPPRSYRQRVAYVPQLPPMFEGTVARNVGAGPALRDVAMPREALQRLLDRVGLPVEFLDRDAAPLSGGERQRVALARALANDPEVLLLDEPTSALDPAMADRVVGLVRTLAADGRAVVVVTHVPEHAQALGGRRFICEAGRLTAREIPS